MSTQNLTQSIKKQLEDLDLGVVTEESGVVLSINAGVCQVYGLQNVSLGELVEFENGVTGLCFNLAEDSVGVILLSKEDTIESGFKVKRLNRQMDVGVGKEYLGRVVDVLGNPIDGKGEIKASARGLVEAVAPGIMDRKSVHQPFQTGIKAIDSLIPIGRGQRELIIGDRQTGKTAVILDSIINQKRINQEAKSEEDKMYCVYVAIGQKMSSVVNLVASLEEAGAMEYSCVVVASASDSSALQYLAPYVGCAIAEYFRDNGMHSVIFYDDLSKQAIAYREISLLLRRSPGREAYPGDVFYLHSRLLERAAKLSDAKGGGSLTALPVVETQANDISAYIPTNVISITDGQIFLESDLFFQGVRPAVNVGNSVSRVGGAAQTKAIKKVTGSIKLELAQYREMAKFSQFSSDLDENTKKTLARGERWVEMLNQVNYKPLSLDEQVISLYAVSKGYLDKVETKLVKKYEASLLEEAKKTIPNVIKNIMVNKDLAKEDIAEIDTFIANFTSNFIKHNA